MRVSLRIRTSPPAVLTESVSLTCWNIFDTRWPRLELMRAWLCEGGLIYLEVPDIQQPYCGNLSRFFQTAHLYSFSRDTLTAVLKKAGLCTIWSRRLVEGKFLRIIARKEAQEPGEIVFPVDDWRQVVFPFGPGDTGGCCGLSTCPMPGELLGESACGESRHSLPKAAACIRRFYR